MFPSLTLTISPPSNLAEVLFFKAADFSPHSYKSIISFPPFKNSDYLGEIPRSLLYFPNGTPTGSLFVCTLNPVEYSPSVLLHLAFPCP